MKVHICYFEDPDMDMTPVHVFFYREDADNWVSESKWESRTYKEMKIE